jgi:hypothetical protein
MKQTTPEQRKAVLHTLNSDQRVALTVLMDDYVSRPWQRYTNDPVGFVTDVLGESAWSKQREILTSIRDNKRTAVPACHAPGKSHIAARAVAWWCSVHPPGTALAITTATTFRQVRAILWPHIRRVINRHGLPGEALTTEWKINGDIAAFGFSAGDNDEAAVQGIHVPHLLIVVDEAGGISHQLGQAFEALMTGSHTRLLTIGNPATDVESSWFEKCCSSPLYNVIRIGAHDTPNFTGEDAGLCKSCPPGVQAHGVATHLVDREWVDDVTQEFGTDSSFVEARVLARFPTHIANKVIPITWLEDAESNETQIQSQEIRLGVDIASDGGDEFVIALADGYTVSVVHHTAGKANENAVDVAGVILSWIHKAQELHAERGVRSLVRVKVDTIGVGWGVVSTLQKWFEEGRHSSEIVPVNVAERASSAERFYNQRAEMWWNARTLFQPREVDGVTQQDVRLDVDRRTIAQLTGPMYASDSAGRITIEKKSELKRRGVPSPDRAEAVLLALFEPPNRSVVPEFSPVSLTKNNEFDWSKMS